MRGFYDDEVSDREEEWSSGIHPDDRERVLAAVKAHFEGRTPVFAEEYRVRHKSGRWIWILDRGLALRDMSGRVIRKPVDLVPALQAAVDTVRSAAEAKGITLVADFGPPPEEALGDATRLQQVVWNLLTNAVKFTPEGGRVELRMESDADSVRITVSDTGKGIEPEFMPFVFDRFRQADPSSARRYGRLGLGLSLVKHLVELHGGTITAASEGAGLGSTFTVTLPRRQLDFMAPTPAVAPREARTEGRH